MPSIMSAKARWLALLGTATSVAAQCTFQNEIDPYTMYNDLHGDSSARTSDDCKANCCSDGSCQVWQWSDDPMTPPNCWSGASDDYGDSGGVEWQGEQGKAGPPGPTPPAVRCVNNTCTQAMPGVPGVDNATCMLFCGVARCYEKLAALCQKDRATGGLGLCSYCAGTHQSELVAAGCTNVQIMAWCGA